MSRTSSLHSEPPTPSPSHHKHRPAPLQLSPPSHYLDSPDSPPTPPRYIPTLSLHSPFLKRLRNISISTPIPLNTLSQRPLPVSILKEFILQKVHILNVELEEFAKNHVVLPDQEASNYGNTETIHRDSLSRWRSNTTMGSPKPSTTTPASNRARAATMNSPVARSSTPASPAPSKLDFFTALCTHLNIAPATALRYKLSVYALFDDIYDLARLDASGKPMVQYFEECVLQRQEMKDFKMRLVKNMEEMRYHKTNTSMAERLKDAFEQLALNGTLDMQNDAQMLAGALKSPVHNIYSRSISLNLIERRGSPRSQGTPKSTRSATTVKEDGSFDTQPVISTLRLSFRNFRHAFRQLFERRDWTTVHDRMVTEIFYCDGLEFGTCPLVPTVEDTPSSSTAQQHKHSQSFTSPQSPSPTSSTNLPSSPRPNSTPRIVTGNETLSFEQFCDVFSHLFKLRIDKQYLQFFKDKLLSMINERNMTIHDLFQYLDKQKNGEIDLLTFRDGLRNDLKLFEDVDDMPDIDVDMLISDWFASIDVDGSGEITEEYFESNLCEKDIIPLLKRKMRAQSNDLEQLFLQVFNGDLGACTFRDFKEGCSRIGIRASTHVLKILFNQIDEDGSLTITLDEFIAAIGLNFSPEMQSVKEVILHKLYLMNMSLDELYADIDAQGTGINYEQFRNGLQNHLKIYLHDRILRQVFKQMDEFNTGVVNYRDFANCINQQQKIKSIKQKILLNAEKRGDSLLDLFSRFDDDKSGDLSMDEIKMGLRVYCGVDCPSDILREFFSIMDRDGNNSADAEEFEGALHEIRVLNVMKAKLDMSKQFILHRVTQTMERKATKLESLQGALENLFDRMDVMGTNRLDFYGFRDGLRKQCDVTVEDTIIRLLFDDIDYWARGNIRMEEFVQALTELCEMNVLLEGIRMQGSLRKSFDRYFDVDRKGEIDFDRFQKGCSQILTITSCRKRVMRMCFNKADINGSETVSFAEFEALCSKAWDTYNIKDRGIPPTESKKKHKLSKVSTYYSNLFRRRGENSLDDYEDYMQTINSGLYDENDEQMQQEDEEEPLSPSQQQSNAPESSTAAPESRSFQNLDMFFSLEKLLPSVQDRPAILRALERSESYEVDLENKLRAMLASHPQLLEYNKDLQRAAQNMGV